MCSTNETIHHASINSGHIIVLCYLCNLFQIGFEATMTGHFSGDIAVDSVQMSQGRCEGTQMSISHIFNSYCVLTWSII